MLIRTKEKLSIKAIISSYFDLIIIASYLNSTKMPQKDENKLLIF